MAQISTEDDVWPPSAQAQSSTTFRHTDNGASTLSLPPANRSGSDEQPTKPSILTSEIHREVMGLLILVAKQDASPMRSSMAKLPSHDRTELTDSSTILAMQSDMNNDISRATASHSDDQQTWHFDSLGWRQQKGLLQRIIRRLRGWNKVVRGDDEEDNRYLGNDKETEEMAEIYFSTIGKVLTEKEEHIDSSPDHEKSRNSAVERNEPETETIGQVMNPEHKIILSSIVFRRTVVEEADYSETEAEDSQIEDDSDEDSQLEDDSDEDSQLEDDSDEDSQLEDGSDEDSQLGDDPAEDSRIEDDSDEDSWIEGLNNDCVLRSEFAEKHLRTTIKCLKSQRQYRPLSIACYLSTDSNHLQLDLARLADTEFPGGFQEVTAGDYFEETELELS
ncbi:hypothetical protein TrVGV298_000611 [Trichoderma virens]|nr:hypothetical protein TrVGV298_000611 [Trichoderma virens]